MDGKWTMGRRRAEGKERGVKSKRGGRRDEERKGKERKRSKGGRRRFGLRGKEIGEKV